ncbi:lipase [Phtheirospermum japonicum]|uniref:Lipase n=1 Tax=Phtheirospermum japonicum TaxID=374723 RepID=A0A830CAY8_9LAMI|nr:lipase [Phtheirospermum japonicum]
MGCACDEEYNFCESYLVIRAEQASCLDLLRTLCSKDLEKRDYLNTPVRGGSTRFRYRWIVFISVLLQKVLICLRTPMAAVGSTVELWLNFPAANGGYGRMISNLFTGGLERPDKSSATFTSIAANVDKRWNLDTSDNASIAMMASKLSYENQSFVRNVVTNHWQVYKKKIQMEFTEFYNFWNDYQKLDTTCAIMFHDKTDPNLIVVAFRGTEPFSADDWRTDIDISWYEFRGVGRIHSGFLKALGQQKSTGWPKEISAGKGPTRKQYSYYTIREKLRTIVRENGSAKFILTGHSMGGALAILFAGVLAMHEEELLLSRLEGVYTFGQPRVGDERFGEYIKGKMRDFDVKYFRFVYSNDMVPRLPYDDKTFLFKHFGPCLYFNSCYKGQVLEEEPNKNYFSLLHVVPKILTAVYQLIRGFILPWTKGEDYREGWLMKLLRVTALLIPGLADHILVDYVNLTRLGKLPSSVYPLGPNQNLKQD